MSFADDRREALSRAAELHRKMAAAALVHAAQGKLARPQDIVDRVDLDGIHLDADGNADGRQLAATVQAAREAFPALVWNPAAPDSVIRRPITPPNPPARVTNEVWAQAARRAGVRLPEVEQAGGRS